MSQTKTRRQGEREREAPRLRLRVSASQPAQTLPAPQRTRLTNLLIAKSFLEILLVLGLAIGFYLNAFSPYFRGTLDEANAGRVAGWALDESDLSARVEVQLYLNGRFIASRIADQPRPDLVSAGVARDERYGFVFELPPLPPGEYEARVYAAHASGAGARRTLQLIGRPRRFQVAAEQSRAAAGQTPSEERAH